MSIFDIFDKLNSDKPAAAGKPEFIIVGLGNPGLQYENTRHNAGFMTIDTIAEKYNADVKKLQFKALVGNAVIMGKSCLLMKPQTYMNNSGEAVVAAMNFYKIPVQNVIVCYDDISLEPSFLRIRRKGSDGGHNGIKSIIELTGEDTFPRIKIGVGKKPNKDYDLANWVLSSFSDEERKLIKEAADKAVQSVELMVQDKADEAMNKFNS